MRADHEPVRIVTLRELESDRILWRRSTVMSDEASSEHNEPRPLLIVNPLDDVSFGAAAYALLDGCDEAAELEARLRRRYPRAVVHPRELAGEQKLVWYVYRDGHWVPSQRRR